MAISGIGNMAATAPATGPGSWVWGWWGVSEGERSQAQAKPEPQTVPPPAKPVPPGASSKPDVVAGHSNDWREMLPLGIFGMIAAMVEDGSAPKTTPPPAVAPKPKIAPPAVVPEQPKPLLDAEDPLIPKLAGHTEIDRVTLPLGMLAVISQFGTTALPGHPGPDDQSPTPLPIFLHQPNVNFQSGIRRHPLGINVVPAGRNQQPSMSGMNGVGAAVGAIYVSAEAVVALGVFEGISVAAAWARSTQLASNALRIIVAH